MDVGGEEIGIWISYHFQGGHLLFVDDGFRSTAGTAVVAECAGREVDGFVVVVLATFADICYSLDD